ncbi:5-methyltetrahydrofolate--homocysteine methyltransferase [Desulfacinum infernum DSM 9756]|uniref:5-methyltetrahydrofolate--homocysteine methyltransferase n=1 Tax=Desulfacinum infernum DSM 9756 TaxID=1121391 RepID=A0A1M5BQN7_9BACT|nr:methyltetrahydrofolate cobalamin methyltransferase [Desulfacinum infernum]SHF44721.1 5-methyltetrahydrofolate--homocysteine methyltransferase [Desulfacinum infernum DSM 9756]
MFTVIGERINTTRKPVRQAVEARDAAFIQADVKRQQDAGAHYIDVNAGARVGREREDMEWLLDVIQEEVSIPLCLDSPDPRVLEAAYERVERPPLINSISLEKERLNNLIPFLRGKDCGVVALCMDDSGLPKDADEVLDRARQLVEKLEGIGMPRHRIYIDPLVQPVSTRTEHGPQAITAVRKIMTELEGVHTVCGLSNVSFGLPKRRAVNRAFLSLMMAAGLDAAILDPLDASLMATLITSNMLLGRDEYCMDYIDAVRDGRIAD